MRRLYLYLEKSDFEAYVNLTGASGSYVSTPDSAAVSVTGDLDLRVDLSMADWTPGAGAALLSKWDIGGSSRSYHFLVSDIGELRFQWRNAAGTTTDRFSGAVPSFTNNTRYQVRVTLDVNNGSGQHEVKFFTRSASHDLTSNTGWTQLGSTFTGSGTTSIFDGTATVGLGTTGGTNNRLTGRVYRASISNAIGGAPVAEFNPSRDAGSGYRTFASSSTNEVWTINGNAELVGGTMVSSNIWTSSIIDLYDNDSYKNFSTIKSLYGSGLIGNSVWTGVEARGATPTDGSGFAVGNRYIDFTGQIDIVNVIIPDEEIVLSGTGSVDARITLYTAESPTAAFPDEWTQEVGVDQYADFNLSNCFRYLRIKIEFSGPQGISVDEASVYVRIEIGPPNINPLFARTKAILNKFPSWMDIRELETEVVTEQNYLNFPDSNTLSYSSTPKSLGAQYINAAFGEWIDEIDQKVNELELQRYIDTVNPDTMAWCYRSENAPNYVYSVVGDGVQLGCAVTLKEFYEADSTEHVYWWNEVNKTIYSNKEYTVFQVNQNVYTQEPMMVWNYFDEFALLVDLRRLPFESNENLRLRILDVHKNKPGTSIENFKLAIRRELDLWRVYGSTPDSNFSGATPEVFEIPDIEKSSEYVDEEGMPTQKFKHLVNWLSFEYPTTWGRFIFDEAIWDVAGENYEGYSVLPNRLDATPAPNAYTQSGVGDSNDLLLYRPEAFLTPQDFTARLKIRGKRKINTTEFSEIRLPFELYGQANRKIYNNPIIYPWFTLEVVRNDAGATPSAASTYFYSFQVRAQSNVDVGQATNTSLSEFVFLTEGDRTNPEIFWARKSDGVFYQDGSSTPSTPLNAMRLDQIASITLKHGKWNVATQAYTNKETTDNFTAWLSNTRVGSFVNFDGSSGTHVSTPDSSAASVVGSIDIRSRFSMDDWTPSSTQTIILKGRTTDANNVSYKLSVNTSGQLVLTLSSNGTTLQTATSSIPTNFTNGSSRWVRVTWDSSSGVVQFFTDDGRISYEYTKEPTLWKQLGSNRSISSITSIYDSLFSLELGSINSGTAERFQGNLYYLQIRNGISGPVVVEFNPERDAFFPYETWTSTTGEVWSLEGNAEYRTFEPYTGATPNSTYAKLRYDTSLYYPTMLGGANSPRAYVVVQSNLVNYTIGKWKSPKIPYVATISGPVTDVYANLTGASGAFVSAPDKDAYTLTNLEIVARVRLVDWTPATPSMIMSYLKTDPNRNWRWYLNTAGRLIFEYTPTGFNANALAHQSSVLSLTNNATYWLKVTFENNVGGLNRTSFYWAEDQQTEPSSWQAVGSTTSHSSFASFPNIVSTLELGSDSGGTTNRLNGRIYYAALRNGVGGATVAEFNPLRDASLPATTVVSQTGETWTVNGAATLVDSVSQMVPVPEIPWDNYLETSPNKEIVIELTARSVNNKYGGVTEDSDGNIYFLDESYFSVNGNSTWVSGYQKTLSWTGLNNLTFSSNDGPLYPVPGYYWDYIEYNQTSTFEGTVSEFGPYINGQPPSEGNVDFVFTRQFIDRNDFAVPNTSDYVITWMGIECLDNRDVIVWIDSNTVKPAGADPNSAVDYPENAIIETLESGLYNFGSIAMYARLRPNPAPQWNPHINAGYLYDKNDEYYLYANSVSENFTNQASPSLRYVARQGAPIIVEANSIPPKTLRQVWFFDEDASPVSLSLVGRQVITPATPVSDIYLAYDDIYDVSVSNTSTGQQVSGVYSSSTNKVALNQYLQPGETYLASYKVRGSFYSDNDAFAGSTPCTRVYFDQLPVALGATSYSVTYETSVLHAATPIPLDLSPFYTTFEEGFVFISFNEYDLSKVEIRISPSSIVANGQDYIMITLRSLDQYGNPKPKQNFTLSTTWGTISNPNVVTDKDGFAVTYLQASATSSTFSGRINVSGGTTAQVGFDIVPAATPSYLLHALPTAEMVPADGYAQNLVIGSVRDATYSPVPNAYVNWARARSVSDLFIEPPVYSGGSGLVVTDASGNFSIGPFTAATPDEPGYWFVSARSSNASPNTEAYVNLTGASGSYVSTPDSAAVSVTGDLDLRVDLSMADWTPGVFVALLSKWDIGGSSRSYQFTVSDFVLGGLRLQWRDAAGVTGDFFSTAYPAFTDNERYQVRVTLDVDNGAGQHEVKFFTRSAGNDLLSNTGWTQLGATKTGSGTTSIFDGTATVGLGTSNGTNNRLTGRVYRASISNAIGGAPVAEFNPSRDAGSGYRTFASSSTNEVWTINGNAEFVGWTEVGDVVFWLEYPDVRYGIENMSGLPRQSVQHATPSRLAVPMFEGSQYPVDLTPSSNIVASTPSTKYWIPRKWMPVSWYYLKEAGYWGQLEIGATPNDQYYSNIVNLNKWTIGY